jgi:hypothetical protein
MLEHGARVDEGTVLFRILAADHLPDEFFGSHLITACQDDRPELIRCAV